jgi:nitrogen regulatory protein P-II 1
MKEIKAFLHRSRVADVVHALRAAGFRNISLVDVKGMLQALNALEGEYSIEFGEAVVTEAKLEVVCENNEVLQAVALIQQNGRTGRSDAGWIYVANVVESYPIEQSGPR